MPGRLAIGVAVGSLAFAVALAAESFVDGEEIHEHFQNPGPVNVLSTAQLIMVAGFSVLAALTRPAHRAFWFVFAAGFLLFAVDQQWKTLTGSAEQDLHGAAGNYLRDNFVVSEPLIMQWSDAVVGLYFAVGAFAVFRHREEFLSSARVSVEIVLALAFAFLMVVSDSLVRQVPAVKVTEETFKLLAGSFFLASVVGICGREGLALVQRSGQRVVGTN